MHAVLGTYVAAAGVQGWAAFPAALSCVRRLHRCAVCDAVRRGDWVGRLDRSARR
jgi:hypothetical protein